MSTLTRVQLAYARIHAVDRPEIWIDLRRQPEVEAEARGIDARLAAGTPLNSAQRASVAS